MTSITALNGCVGCGPSSMDGLGYPARIYGAPFNGLGAFDSGPLLKAMAVIGILVAVGLVVAAKSGKKRA